MTPILICILAVLVLVAVSMMVKSRDRVERKMKDRMALAGTELAAGMAEAEDPAQVILDDIDNVEKRMLSRQAEAVKKGKYRNSLKTAADQNRYHDSIDMAAKHYEEKAEVATKRAMETYEIRAAAIERAKAKVKNMPRDTRDQRMAYGLAYQKAVAEEFDKAFGRS